MPYGYRAPTNPSDSEAAADLCEHRADYACAIESYRQALYAGTASGQAIGESARRRIVGKLRGMVGKFPSAEAMLLQEYSAALARIAERPSGGGSVALDISLVAEIGVATVDLRRLVSDTETIRRRRADDVDTPALLEAKIAHVLVATQRYEDAAHVGSVGLDYVLSLRARRPEVEPFAVVLLLQEIGPDEYEIALARGDLATARNVLERCLSKYPDALLVDAFSSRARKRADRNADAEVRDIATRYHATSSVLVP